MHAGGEGVGAGGGGAFTVVLPIEEGGVSPHLGQKVAVDVMVVVESVILMEVILPLVMVTGQLVNVVTTISVVTRSDEAGVVLALLVVCGTQPVPEKVDPDPHVGAVGLTGVVKGTHFPSIAVSVVAHEVGVVTPPVGVFGTHVPPS